MTPPIRVLVVDDEPRARRAVVLLLNSREGFEIVGEAGDGESAVRLVRELRPELLFLDIQMPGLTGFEALARIPKAEMPEVVFVTAYDTYAMEAFAVHALDYVLKPFEDERFHAAVDRARERIRDARAAGMQSRLLDLLESVRGFSGAEARAPALPTEFSTVAPPRAERIILKNGSEVVVLKPQEIDWIEADGDYMKFHVGGRGILHRETMASLEARLDPSKFRRIHRSTIVNLDRIVRLVPCSNGEHTVVLVDGSRLRSSKGYQDRLQEWLNSGS
jgi:two-component system LytT family response regulator